MSYVYMYLCDLVGLVDFVQYSTPPLCRQSISLCVGITVLCIYLEDVLTWSGMVLGQPLISDSVSAILFGMY